MKLAGRIRSAGTGILLALLLTASTTTVASACEFTVTTDAANGPGSLVEALLAAQSIEAPCRISFGERDGPFSTPRTIEIGEPLPIITGQVTIDGFIDRLLWRAYGVTISGGGRHGLLNVAPGASLTLRGVTLRDGFAPSGGAVVNRGRLVVDSSSLFDNEATEAGGAIFSTGETILVNSTLIGNRAPSGGAIASAQGRLHIVHATFNDNLAEQGGAVHALGRMYMANSILSGSGSQCHALADAEVLIHNLIHGQHHGCGQPLLTGDPRFERLGYYNGPTKTLALNGASPAINLALTEAAVDADGRRLVWDQRGNGDPRFAGGYADLGAFERQAPLPEAIEVNAIEDNGLRVCTGQGRDNCSLRAAIEVAAAGRHLVPVRFSHHVFDRPMHLKLDVVSDLAELPLVLDGQEQVAVAIEVPCTVAWEARSGVTLVVPDPGVARENCDDRP
jgi:hypothetical protein